jgi:hypothetical protein
LNIQSRGVVRRCQRQPNNQPERNGSKHIIKWPAPGNTLKRESLVFK